MSKSFRDYQPEQRMLFPASLEDWLPDGHLAHFINDTVEEFNLEEIYRSYEEDGRGQSAYHPLLMVKVLFYGYATGRYSSRRLEAATYDEVPMRFLAANQHPDHSTLAEFRRRHLAALSGLFGQILLMCRRAGLVGLSRVAIDGTKVRANAHRGRGRTYAQMKEEEQQLTRQIREWLQRAEHCDAAEDQELGELSGCELPPSLATRQKRLETIQRLKAEMEREAREAAERQSAEIAQRREVRQEREQEAGRRFGGREPQRPDPETARPAEDAQRNLTDPDSRIMRDGATRSLQQSYNAQAAVDEQRQVIVAVDVTQQANDRAQLVPLVEQIVQTMGRRPAEVSADSDYFSSQQLASPWLAGVDVYVPPEPERRARAGPAARRWDRRPDLTDAMRQKMRSAEGRRRYRKRQAIVEPVFGVIKQWRGFRQFSMRGLEKVQQEWKLVCAVHNLHKLFGARSAPQPA